MHGGTMKLIDIVVSLQQRTKLRKRSMVLLENLKIWQFLIDSRNHLSLTESVFWLPFS